MRGRTKPPVPFIERRQHVRVLTLKNAGLLFLVLFVAFLAVSIRSEMRGRNMNDYGRIVSRALPDVEQQPVDVVPEALPPVEDQSVADPMLVEPMQREQWLYEPAPPASGGSAAGDGSSVAIVGDSAGVAITRSERRRPVLSGGFGRPADEQEP